MGRRNLGNSVHWHSALCALRWLDWSWRRSWVTKSASPVRLSLSRSHGAAQSREFCTLAFGVVCFALVGLELASIMGDEIREPRKTVPFAVAWGGAISGILYIGIRRCVLCAGWTGVGVDHG